MDYIKEYKSFVNSHYLSEGVRITAGIVLPAVVLNYFNLLSVGVVVALGAMCVSVTDNPGPVHHRKNGMIACIIINTIMAGVAGLLAPFPFLLGILIVLACFIFSMIGVYGSRVNSIGLSALLIMVLNIDRQHQGWELLSNAAYIFAGGVWYMLLSLLLHSFRPYKLAQQALGDCIMATADYLRVRSSFYRKEVDYERTYQQMLEEQIAVHEKQNLVRELLYKSRHIIRDSTTTGRTLVMIFTDIVDLFERTMNSYQDYKAMHEAFGEDDILQKYRELILELSNELDEIGIAVKSGEASAETDKLADHIEDAVKYFEDFRDRRRTADNLDSFINLRHILNSIGDIANRIHTLHLYTTYDKEIVKKAALPSDYDQFVSHEKIDLKILKDNFTLQSNTFRHALRISIATLAGFIISLFFPFGHSYWILLTIIVILKPAYSLTKKRNYERVIGTIAGAVIGIVILHFVKNNDALFVIMLCLMLATYSLWRTNYMFSVVFMTPYILLLFHLITDASFKTILSDRIIDTAIGSAIAFLANISLLPAWEHEKIAKYMLEALTSNKNYFKNVSAAFTGNPVTNTEYKVSRKNAFVALANLSDAFSRMMAEPKRKQKSIKELHQFVVLNHMLTSHIATLASYVRPLSEKYASPDFAPAINRILARMDDGEKILGEEEAEQVVMDDSTSDIIQQRLQNLLNGRREEIKKGIQQSETQKKLTEFKPLADQFNFIGNLSKDIKVLGEKWMDNDLA
ncbi:MAG TPA: FUSC family membrane protein [Ferruginibacter sp.]|nr:FUSC family membrane protein [Ferruginibacter sp.]HPH91215.1 FUSC family membrane protein [Ferruginibacter sp.]